jgi:CBS-domain-containing membrane protein
MTLEVPDRMSQRRAAAISGLSREAIARAIPSYGEFEQISRSDLEALIGRPIDLASWDAATLALSRKAMQDAA